MKSKFYLALHTLPVEMDGRALVKFGSWQFGSFPDAVTCNANVT